MNMVIWKNAEIYVTNAWENQVLKSERNLFKRGYIICYLFCYISIKLL